jgi:hypothetical protein
MLTFDYCIRKMSLSERANFYRAYLKRMDHNLKGSFYTESKFEDFRTFVSSAFIWEDTPEGHDYWYAVSIKNNY